MLGRSLHLILIALLKHCKTVKKMSGTKINLAAFSMVMKILMAFYSPAMIACLGKLNFMQLHKNIVFFLLLFPFTALILQRYVFESIENSNFYL